VAASEVQESKPLNLSTGDRLLHKKGAIYHVIMTEFYFSEPFVVDGVEYLQDTPCVLYHSEVTGKRWGRPRFMFTEDRFTIIGNIYL
jgi:hypothetical protein